MDKKIFENGLSPETIRILDQLFRGNLQRRNTIINTASAILNENETKLFDTFIQSKGFKVFLRRRKAISIIRFEQSVSILLSRISSGTDPVIIADIAEAMGSDKYHRVERSFFMFPVDRRGYEIFQQEFINTGEQDISILPEYLDFCVTEEYIFLRAAYAADPVLYTMIFKKLISLLLSKKNHQSLIYAVRQLISDHIRSLIQSAKTIGKDGELTDLLFDIFHHSASIDVFFAYIKVFCQRYRSISKENTRLILVRHTRLMEVWRYCTQADIDELDHFRDFINMYGNSTDEFEAFIWDIVFSLENIRAERAISILVSQAFNSLKGFYSNDRAIIKFLVKNIISAIAELDIKNFTSPLYGIVLKLFLGLKLNRGFIKRRAEFFAWLKTQTSSLKIEMEVIRFMFFEYIYIALKIVPGGIDVKMTKCSDERHLFFVEVIDSLPQGKTKVNEKEFYDGYKKVLLMLRDFLWKDAFEKFPGDHHTIYDLKNIAESTDSEEEIITALDSLEQKDLKKYSDALIATFRKDPENTREATLQDYWYRVLLADALPYCQSVLIPVVGTIDIKESEGGAYTDGKAIFLPAYISYFKDEPEPLIENRNLTVYIGYTLHEAGHIAGGSYHFNISAYLEKVERPELLRTILNFFEDYRIESLLVKIRAHHQIQEILRVTNEHLSMINLNNFISISFDFLVYIFDEAGGYNIDLKSDTFYLNKINTIMNSDLNTGRFRGMKELAEYGITRLQNMDVGNPLAAFPLAKEFYEIIKHWPEPDLAGLSDRHGLLEGYSHEQGEAGSKEGERIPLSREQLDELYRMYNNNPEDFLRSRGIRVFSNLLPGEEKNKNDKGGSAFDEVIDQMLAYAVPDYSLPGTFDFSTRTKADELIALDQIDNSNNKKDKGKNKGPKKKGGQKKKPPDKTAEKPKEKNIKKYVYSIDPRTGSRTKLSEIKEFTVKAIDRNFMSRFKKWEYLSGRIEQQLAVIIPSIEDNVEFSSLEGDLDIDLLIDILSDRNLIESSPEIFEIRDEQKRSLEVAIGLDASGSTALNINTENDTILDIEKVFAIIFGRALNYITDKVSIYAFNSFTSTNIYRAHTIEAASSFISNSANRDGDFIRYITHRLKQSDAEVKYFFMLSDGQPNSENYDGKEALDDTLIAMRETVHSGIKLIYFNFDTMKRDYFELFQNEATYARYFKSPEEILSAVPSMLKTVADSIR